MQAPRLLRAQPARRHQAAAASSSTRSRSSSSSRRSAVAVSAQAQPGNRVEQWLKTPFDIISFGPRVTVGALVSLPERLQTLPSDVQRVSELVQDPRPVEEKQAAVLQEVEDTLVTFLERGATLETDVLANLKVLLPPEVVTQLDELIPPPPNAAPPPPSADELVGEPLVIYTADSVLENQIAAEMTEIQNAVSGVKASLEELRANSDAARAAMLRLNLREARDILSRRLEETAPGSAPAGGDPSLAAATREATVLLAEVDAQFFSNA